MHQLAREQNAANNQISFENGSFPNQASDEVTALAVTLTVVCEILKQKLI